MTLGQIFGLAVMGVLFLLWTVLMFRTLFQLRQRTVARTGQSFPGPITTLKEWRIWLTAPGDRTSRRWLGATTLALLIWIIVQAIRAG